MNEITYILPIGNGRWRHVLTYQNITDLIHRGVNVKAMDYLDMWWSGPNILQKKESRWPTNPTFETILPETRSNITLNSVVEKYTISTIIDFARFLNLSRLKLA